MNNISIDKNMLIFTSSKGEIKWQLPLFPLNNKNEKTNVIITKIQTVGTVKETILEQTVSTSVKNIITVHQPENSSFVRLRYRLEGEGTFPGKDGDAPIFYGAMIADYDDLTEITLSNFDRIQHSYVPGFTQYTPEEAMKKNLTGPILFANKNDKTYIVAYEHGAQTPDSFLTLTPENNKISLRSVRGNYYRNQPVTQYLSPWITLGISDKDDALFNLREHIRIGMNASEKTRYPFLFYNTWNYQERVKIFKNEKYLTEMTEARMLDEIEAAYKMGIEVFVIDTGWFTLIGDWLVNPGRFPGGLKNIKEKLDRYNMQLGLWFNPTLAAADSEAFKKQPYNMMKSNGKDWLLGDVWESGSCYGMCLASGFTDSIIEKSVELHEKLGVTYFKWDGIYQHGCDSDGHYHGGADCDKEEILDAYAYRMGLELTRAAEEIAKRCKGAIVDFDITEASRYVGLGFLSGGKFFSVNNGPYYECFDIPATQKRDPDPINVFFYPGAARSQVCRASSRFDAIIPSTLFLTHYLPEGDEIARKNAAASLVLGGNGIWGDIVGLTDEEMSFWQKFFADYKKVREHAALAYPITQGVIGASPEIHDKINPDTGIGFVSIFTNGSGKINYVTRRLSKKPSDIIGADTIEYMNDRISLTVKLPENGATTVFFI